MPYEQRQKIGRANSESQRKRWADPAKKDRAVVGCLKGWKDGKRSKDRVVWNAEMDDLLRRLYYRYGFQFVRTEGAKKIGVSERSLRMRLKFLGVAGKGDLICDNWDFYDA
jgi:hypothetical protein